MSYDLTKPFSSHVSRGLPAFDTAQMPEMKNAFFQDKDITLDGWRFIFCRFEKCRIHVSSLYFVVDQCFIGDDCIIYYQGESIKLIQLWNSRNEFIRSTHPGFAPRRNPNGTVSIGA